MLWLPLVLSSSVHFLFSKTKLNVQEYFFKWRVWIFFFVKNVLFRSFNKRGHSWSGCYYSSSSDNNAGERIKRSWGQQKWNTGFRAWLGSLVVSGVQSRSRYQFWATHHESRLILKQFFERGIWQRTGNWEVAGNYY